jgi:hypothetical protein
VALQMVKIQPSYINVLEHNRLSAQNFISVNLVSKLIDILFAMTGQTDWPIAHKLTASQTI